MLEEDMQEMELKSYVVRRKVTFSPHVAYNNAVCKDGLLAGQNHWHAYITLK